MSRVKIGKWDDGTFKYCYFSKPKHNKKNKIRKIMYWAWEYKWDCQMYKKFN